ncbi:MAG: glycosyltransferase [Pseudomonadota bacterium]
MNIASSRKTDPKRAKSVKTAGRSGLKASVVICSYNRYHLLGSAIQSCLDQDIGADAFEMIVVDNSPDHAAAEKFGKAFQDHKNLTYIVEKTPGISNARNVGVQACSAEIVAFLDDDAIAKPDWLRQMLKAYEDMGDVVVAAGGKVSPIWGTPRPSWLADNKLGLVSVVDWGGSTRPARAKEWLAGANLSVRKSALENAGGFDKALGRRGGETTMLSNEEIHFVERLQQQGGTVLYVPEAEVDHLVDERRLTQEWFRKRTAWQAASDLIKDPELEKNVEPMLNSALNYLMRQPPRYRSHAGLARDLEHADDFSEQLDAIYNMTVAMLSGYKAQS